MVTFENIINNNNQLTKLSLTRERPLHTNIHHSWVFSILFFRSCLKIRLKKELLITLQMGYCIVSFTVDTNYNDVVTTYNGECDFSGPKTNFLSVLIIFKRFLISKGAKDC